MEFPEGKVNIYRLVEDTLKNAYVRVTGNTPREGSFEPDTKTVRSLQRAFDKRDELIDFLRLSIACHVWMCETGKHPTHTPFYVNNHLLSDKRLELLGKHESKLKDQYGETFNNPNSFNNQVYADVFGVESEYIYSAAAAFMQDIQMQWEMVTPSLYWILASRLQGRFSGLEKTDGLPDIYRECIVKHNGENRYLREAWSRELKNLSSDSKRLQIFEIEAARAFSEARIAWATSANLIQPYKDDMGRYKYSNPSGMPEHLLNVSTSENASAGNLPKTEKKMFRFAKSYLENERSVVFKKHNNVVHVVLGEPQHIADEDVPNKSEKLSEVLDKGDSAQPLSKDLQDLIS
jgi:hypothetical protein